MAAARGPPILGKPRSATASEPHCGLHVAFNLRQTLIVARLVLFAGHFLNRRFAPPWRWNIPEPVNDGRIARVRAPAWHRRAERRILRRHRQCGDLPGVQRVARDAGAAPSRRMPAPRDALPQRVAARGSDEAPAGKACIPTPAQHPFRQSEKTACKGFPSLGIAL